MKKKIVMAFLAMTMATSQVPAMPVMAEVNLTQEKTEEEKIGDGAEGQKDMVSFANTETGEPQQGEIGDNCTYTLDEEGNMIISGTGTLEQMPSQLLKQIRTVVIEEGVTEIGDSAFSDCSSLSEISLPESLTSIGYYAFYSCNSLKEITIPRGVTTIEENAFFYCSSLKNIFVDEKNEHYTGEDGILFDKEKTALVKYPVGKGEEEYIIPDSVISIDWEAFFGCSSLKKITIPESVTEIRNYAFSDCTSLKEITIPESVTTIGAGAFERCSSLKEITIPESVTKIGDYAFSSCSALRAILVNENNTFFTSEDGILFDKEMKTLLACPGGKSGKYTIPDSVQEIGFSAFINCSSLEEVIIPDSVTTIGNQAFMGCSSLIGITLPESVTEIRDDVFTSCSSLEEVIIPASVTTIGEGVFMSCSSLKKLTIPSSVTEIGNYAFRSCKSLVELTLPASVTLIGNYLFYDCNSLEEVTISGNVTEIGNYAFYDCGSLKEITIPESVTMIGNSAFRDCISLSEIIIPESVTMIGNNAFRDCISLSEIILPAGVTEIDEHAFRGCSGLNGIFVNENNTSYVSEDGILFDKDKKVLIACAGGKKGKYAIPDGVEQIEKYAFYNCGSLSEITIPSSVTEIGNYAFSECGSLDTILVNENNACYMSEDGVLFDKEMKTLLTCPAGKSGKYTIPNTVVQIGDNAFELCSSLSAIIMPEGITEIGDDAFLGCSSIEEITIPASVTKIGEDTFSECSSLRTILVKENNRFYTSEDGILFDKAMKTLLACPGGKSGKYIIPGTVTSIGNDAFEYCSSLTEIIIPGSVILIGDDAFDSCSSLTEMIIPGRVISIGTDAFNNCSNLKEITILESVTFIGGSAFYKCDNLTIYCKKDSFVHKYATDYEIPYLFIQEYGMLSDDCSYLLNEQGDMVIFGTGEFESIPANLKEEIKTVVLKDGVTKIGDSAFSGCSSLSEIIIPEGVTAIGASAFNGCSGLSEITIPESVTFIGANAFSGCSDLTIYCGENSHAHQYALENGLPYVATQPETPPATEDDPKKPENPGGQPQTPPVSGNQLQNVPSTPHSSGQSSTTDSIGNGKPETGNSSPEDSKSQVKKGSTHIIQKNKYKVTSNTTVTYLGTTDAKAKKITIPKTIRLNGKTYKVTVIAPKAFKGKKITAVTIGKNVTSIGKNAFLNCKNLKTIVIKSKKLKSVGKNALKGIAKKAKIKVPKKQLKVYKKLLQKKGQGKQVRIIK